MALSRSRIFTLMLLGRLWFSPSVAVPTVAKRESEAAITALSSAQIAAFRPYTHYASTAFCSPASTLAWNCGENCEANPSFKPIASGGDGALIQFWFVGFDPTLQEVIVGHQGTDASKILPVLEDVDIIFEKLDATLFPGVSGSVEVHSGFAGSQSRSANEILAAVKSSLTQFNANKVVVTGHSLGSAIALLDYVYLPLHLPSTTTVRYIGYGLPRVGNEAFANYVDAQAKNVSVAHINNKEDIVPIVPGRFLGFHHPSGEIHIQDSGEWLACPGQDNTDDRCIVGDVPNLFEGDQSDHNGPYDGILMGC